jgi:hypothetical protein
MDGLESAGSRPLDTWVPVSGELRNLDVVPDYYLPQHPCPECGSAYAELAGLKLRTPVVTSLECTDAWILRATTLPQKVFGVRIICCAGHPSEYIPIDPTFLVAGGAFLMMGLFKAKGS